MIVDENCPLTHQNELRIVFPLVAVDVVAAVVVFVVKRNAVVHLAE